MLLQGIEKEYEELDTVWFMAGSLFQNYPYDIPTEAFSLKLFKQVKNPQSARQTQAHESRAQQASIIEWLEVAFQRRREMGERELAGTPFLSP